jgi:hypothetical protein
LSRRVDADIAVYSEIARIVPYKGENGVKNEQAQQARYERE